MHLRKGEIMVIEGVKPDHVFGGRWNAASSCSA
jgi:hypothetical protein